MKAIFCKTLLKSYKDVFSLFSLNPYYPPHKNIPLFVLTQDKKKMKNKIISTLLVTASLFSASLLANPYQGSYQPVTNIAALNAMGPYFEDVPVVLTGNLGQQVGPEYFQFTDNAGGSAMVEVDHEEQYRFGIKAGQPISFFGEAEKEHGYLKIELEFINSVQG